VRRTARTAAAVLTLALGAALAGCGNGGGGTEEDPAAVAAGGI
jgi:hypothetical protein